MSTVIDFLMTFLMILRLILELFWMYFGSKICCFFVIDFGLLFRDLTLLPGTSRRRQGGGEEASRITFPPPSPPRAAP